MTLPSAAAAFAHLDRLRRHPHFDRLCRHPHLGLSLCLCRPSLLPSAAGCASQVRLAPRAAYFYFARAGPHKFESQTRQALLRPTGRGKGNAGKTPTPSSLPRPRGLGRRRSAAGSARVSPVLGGGAAPPGPGPGPRQVSAGTSTESYRPSTFVLGWVSDLASEGFQFVRLAAARMPAAGFCDDGKMCKNT